MYYILIYIYNYNILLSLDLYDEEWSEAPRRTYVFDCDGV